MTCFLHEFRPFLQILYYTGLCPLKVNHQSLIIHTQISSLYKLIVLSLISAILFVQVTDLQNFMNQNSSSGRSTVAAIKWLQSVFNSWIYIITILKSAQNRTGHATLLARIQRFDRLLVELQMVSEIIEETQPYFRQMYWLNVSATLLVWALNLGTLHALRHGADVPLKRQFMELITEIIYATFSLATLYMGDLAILLNQRYSMLCRCLSRDISTWSSAPSVYIFELFDLIWKLLEQFQQVFGMIILLNASVDLLLLVITTYYNTLIGLLNMLKFDMHIFMWVSVTYALIPILKNLWIIWAMNNIGKRVSLWND